MNLILTLFAFEIHPPGAQAEKKEGAGEDQGDAARRVGGKGARKRLGGGGEGLGRVREQEKTEVGDTGRDDAVKKAEEGKAQLGKADAASEAEI